MRDDDFERLFAEHAQPLFSFLAYRCGDRALAEDLVGETFERAYRARRRFDRRRGSERTWLYGIALNALRDADRRAAVRRRVRTEHQTLLEVGPVDGGGAIDRVASRLDLVGALGGLEDVEREALALRFGADMTVPEVAELVGEPLTTVEGRVYRGLRKLRGLLDA